MSAIDKRLCTVYTNVLGSKSENSISVEILLTNDTLSLVITISTCPAGSFESIHIGSLVLLGS